MKKEKSSKRTYVSPAISICKLETESLLQKASGQHAPGTVAPGLNAKRAEEFEWSGWEEDFESEN